MCKLTYMIPHQLDMILYVYYMAIASLDPYLIWVVIPAPQQTVAPKFLGIKTNEKL